MTLEIKLGKYTLIEEIGRGGYGTVYRAYDTMLKVERAVKVLHPALVADPEFIERFKREAQLAAQLEHSNIVPVYDLGEDQGRFFLAMKYMPGGSLKDVLAKEEHIPFDRAVEIASQIAEALGFAHSRGLVHRDVKPGNILLEQDGTARLSDLGFAKALSSANSASLSVSGGIVGTPAYIAPEVWEGKETGPATDVYGLACVVYEMITGDTLFEGETPAEFVKKHVFDGPSFPETWPQDVPEGIESVFRIAATSKPEDRYARAEDFSDALRGLMEKTAVDAKDVKPDLDKSADQMPKPIVTIPKKPSRRRRWIWGVVVVAILFALAMLVIGGGTLFWYTSRPTATTGFVQTEHTQLPTETIRPVQPSETLSPTFTLTPEGISSAYDTEFPLPSNVQNFTGGGGQVNFATSLTVEEAITFYREELTAIGLTEREINTAITETTFSMVFDGHPNGNAIVVQGVDLGNGTTNINIRFEDV